MSVTRRGALLVAAACATATVLSPEVADAYCRTSACGEEVGARCVPPTPDDCGLPLYWESSCVGYSLSRDASSDISLETASALTRAAFDTWQNADCSGRSPDISGVDLGPVDCEKQEYDPDTMNANLIVFRDESWPYESSALALTTVTFAIETAKIRDADVELNSDHADFTTNDVLVGVDLGSILTHEVGHVLGLAHSPVDGATMQTNYPPKSVDLRTLEADDIAAVCGVYAPGILRACKPTPVNGLGNDCGIPALESTADEDCTCAVPGVAPARGRTWSLAGLVLIALARWRRRAR